MVKLHENISELFEDLYIYLNSEKEKGKKIIAYFGHEFIPPEIIEASGAVPLKLIFAGNEEFMTIGADYLGPTSCVYARSLLGMFEKKDEIKKYKFLNLIDAIIISNYCTSNLLTAEAICKFFNVKGIEFFIPYRTEQNHINYYKEQLITLSKNLSEFTGIPIDSDKFKEIVLKYYKFRNEIAKINDSHLDAQVKQLLYYDSILFGPDEIDLGEIAKLTNNLNNTDENGNNTQNIILTGCPIYIGDKLEELVFSSGGNIIFDNTWIGEGLFNNNSIFNIENEDNLDPLEYLTSIYKSTDWSAHKVPKSVDNSIKHLLDTVIDRIPSANGMVLNHMLKFCDIIGYNRQELKEKLTSNNIKIINLERDYSSETSGQIKTRIEAFLEMGNKK